MENDIKTLGLYVVVLVGLAAVILTGIAVVTQYQDFLKLDTGLTNESITISSGTGTTANDEIVSISYFGNSTTISDTSITTTTTNVNYTADSGVILVNTSKYPDDSYDVSYIYQADTSGSDVADNFVTGLAIFGGFVLYT